ncbi:alpha/beta fold hydrolase [Pelobium manganitolerans]|uniref:alpha/beta fold hydrolase n=1 Tax=Pelobium manganitolerans TaxID=1842495 RepID=UPI003FA38796
MKTFLLSALICATQLFAFAQKDTLSITLENVDYAYPVQYFALKVENQDVRMAYMDVKPKVEANGKAVVLLHGKNFGGYYWGNVIEALTEKGYRVIVPDQIGFGKSSKPIIHYSFHEMAKQTKMLLDSLGVDKVNVLGHSMGGMLATRFALMFPGRTGSLILEDAIGLEDYRTFVPYQSAAENYQSELKKSAESIKSYYQNSYFPEWRADYDYLVDIAAGVIPSADYPRWAMVSALTSVMIYEQPVVYEFENLKVPTTVMVGTKDHTIVGKALLNKAEQAKHGLYKELGKATASKIPHAKLVEFDGVGHIPHLQVFPQFMDELLKALR